MKILVDNSQLPIDLQYPKILEVDNADVEAFKLLDTLKNNIDKVVKNGDSIYLWSTKCGNGKTTWASKLLMAYFNKIWVFNQLKCRGIYLYTPTLLNRLKSQFLENKNISEFISEIKNAELVVFDDLGVGKLSDFDRNNLLDIIDYRLNSHKSMIFTSNLDIKGLTELFGDRLASRIYNNAIIIQLNGRDRRGERR